MLLCGAIRVTHTGAYCATHHSRMDANVALTNSMLSLCQRMWCIVQDLAARKAARDVLDDEFVHSVASASASHEAGNAAIRELIRVHSRNVREQSNEWNIVFGELRLAVCAGLATLTDLGGERTDKGSVKGSSEGVQDSSGGLNVPHSDSPASQCATSSAQQKRGQGTSLAAAGAGDSLSERPLRSATSMVLHHPTSFRGRADAPSGVALAQPARHRLDLIDDCISIVAVESERGTPAESHLNGLSPNGAPASPSVHSTPPTRGIPANRYLAVDDSVIDAPVAALMGSGGALQSSVNNSDASCRTLRPGSPPFHSVQPAHHNSCNYSEAAPLTRFTPTSSAHTPESPAWSSVIGHLLGPAKWSPAVGRDGLIASPNSQSMSSLSLRSIPSAEELLQLRRRQARKV